MIPSRKFLDDRPLQCHCFEQAVVVPHWGATAPTGSESGGVIDAEGRDILSSVFITEEYSVRKPLASEIVESDEEAIFIGNFLPVFGHILTDGLKRLWYCYTKECQQLVAAGAKLVYVTYFDGDLKPWEQEVLQLAGVDTKQCVRIRQATRFKKVYVPDISIELHLNKGRFFHRELLTVVEHIKSQLKPDTRYDKIYFTRRQLKGNRMKDFHGEGDLERLFVAAGYKVIAPEQYSVREQLEMAMGCKAFAATEGSSSHHTLFCLPGTKVTLLHKVDYPNSYQEMINEAVQLDVTYYEAHHSTRASRETPWLGPFYLCISADLKRDFGYQRIQIPVYCRPTYWGYWLLFSKPGIAVTEFLRKIKRKIS